MTGSPLAAAILTVGSLAAKVPTWVLVILLLALAVVALLWLVWKWLQDQERKPKIQSLHAAT